MIEIQLSYLTVGSSTRFSVRIVPGNVALMSTDYAKVQDGHSARRTQAMNQEFNTKYMFIQ